MQGLPANVLESLPWRDGAFWRLMKDQQPIRQRWSSSFGSSSCITLLQKAETPVVQTQISYNRLNETEMYNMPTQMDFFQLHLRGCLFPESRNICPRRQQTLQHIDPIHPGTGKKKNDLVSNSFVTQDNLKVVMQQICQKVS